MTPTGDAPPLVTHWIDGTPDEGSSSRRGDVFDPATGRVTKHVTFASVEDVDHAVVAARTAFGAWRVTSLTERTKVLFAFRELLHRGVEELAEIITAEHSRRGIPEALAREYLTQHIRFEIGPAEREGLSWFLEYAAELHETEPRMVTA